MLPCKEVEWLIRIENSRACKDSFTFRLSARPMCKTEFGRIAGAPTASKEFSEWFNELLSRGIFEFSGMIDTGHRGCMKAKGYIVHSSKIHKYFQSHQNEKIRELYDLMSKFYSRDRII